MEKIVLEKTSPLLKELTTKEIRQKDPLTYRTARALIKLLNEKPELWQELQTADDVAQIVQVCYNNDLTTVEELEERKEIIKLFTNRGLRTGRLIDNYFDKFLKELSDKKEFKKENYHIPGVRKERIKQYREFYTTAAFYTSQRNDKLLSDEEFLVAIKSAGIFIKEATALFVDELKEQNIIQYREGLKMYQFVDSNKLNDYFTANFVALSFQKDKQHALKSFHLS